MAVAVGENRRDGLVSSSLQLVGILIILNIEHVGSVRWYSHRVYIKLVALPTTNHCCEHDGAAGPITFVLEQHLAHSREPVTSDHSSLRTSNQ